MSGKIFRSKQSFTLGEILVVIGILAVITTAGLLTLNPTERIKEARDAQRIGDMTALNAAIQAYLWQNPGASIGETNTVYLSLPDTSSLCENVETPSLPATSEGGSYQFHCVSKEDLRKTDGTGWLPINFSSAPASGLSSLPIDPINNLPEEELGDYYVYMASGNEYQLASSIESEKFRSGGPSDVASQDGGVNLGLFERGTNLSLIPYDFGDVTMVQYIDFNKLEPVWTELVDKSAYSANLFPKNGAAIVTGSMCLKDGCAQLDGVNDYIGEAWEGSGPEFSTTDPYTLSMWMNWDENPTSNHAAYFGSIASNLSTFRLRDDSQDVFRYISLSDTYYDFASSTSYQGTWTHTVWVVDGEKNMTMYINGEKIKTLQVDDSAYALTALGKVSTGDRYFKGYLDELRVFSRALTAEEVKTLYEYER